MSEEIKKIATRESYGNALVELGKERDDFIVLDADLADATKTGKFKKAFPDRFYDCGIAEQNLINVACGVASTGKRVFASSFAMFAAGRAYENIRNGAGYPHLNVIVAATHAGITVGEDGATHQCNEDIALMRTIPGMTVICPADDTESKQAVRAAMEIDGPVYLRFSRAASPVIFDESDEFTVGKAKTVREGKDITIISTGILTAEAIAAADTLKSEGISARVLNIHTIKPIDKEAIIKAAKETGKIITVEEHSIIGGLGSAVCDVVCEEYPVPVYKMGVPDCFGYSASADYLLDAFKLRAKDIAEKAKEVLG
ncbi:MAG: transketolase family protein [Clostridia bacterium]|nr:transketolase family protein [Clostridia bacterium]